MKGKLESLIIKGKLPRHVVIIMDGNGRWANRKGFDRISGHREGMKSVKSVVKAARELGVEAVTLYAFSAQNWKRPKGEVEALMELLKQYLFKECSRLIEKEIRLNAIGRLTELPSDVYRVLVETMEKTNECKKMTLTLALSYGGREEIVDAVKKIISNSDGLRRDLSEENFSPLAACLHRDLRHKNTLAGF